MSRADLRLVLLLVLLVFTSAIFAACNDAPVAPDAQSISAAKGGIPGPPNGDTELSTTRFPIIDLGTLGGNSSSATDVNARGQVVGLSETESGERHAFLWTTDDGMIDLGTLGGSSSTAPPSATEESSSVRARPRRASAVPLCGLLTEAIL